MVQWIENQFNPKEIGFRGGKPFDFHPNDFAHSNFCNKILIPLIEESRK
jgi:hypothetical protein